MPEHPPSPIAYATPRADAVHSGDTRSGGWETAFAIGSLIVAVVILLAAADRFADEQRMAVEMYDKLNMSFAWSKLIVTPAAALLPGMAVAFGLGVVASAGLVHWPATRLAWVAAVPAAAAAWVGFQWATDTWVWSPAAMLQLTALGMGRYGVGGPPANAGVGFVAQTLAAMAVAQALFAYLGSLAGRPMARGLARLLLPPPLQAAVGGLWDGRVAGQG